VRTELRKQALPVVTFIAVLVGISVVLQLWLLGTSLEAVLAGRGELASPAAIASALLFAVNVGFFLYVVRVDRRVNDEESNSRP
jgi:hypothetical protein